MHDSEISQRFSQSLERIGDFLILSFSGFSLYFPSALVALNSVFWLFKPIKCHFPLALFTPIGHRLGPVLRLKTLKKEKKKENVRSAIYFVHESTLFQYPCIFIHSLAPSSNWVFSICFVQSS